MVLKDIVDRIYNDLQDPDQSVWTDRTEIEGYVRNGYFKLCRDTGCLWDVTFSENLPYCGDHTGFFEEPFMPLFSGRFTFTGNEWERDYSDNGVGPANYTGIFEMLDPDGNMWNSKSTGTVIGQDFILPTSLLDETMVSIDRITHDSYRVLPAVLERIKRFDGRYQYTQGPTRSWTFEDDGLLTFRKIPVPAARANTFSYSAGAANTGNWGLLRTASANEFNNTTGAVDGTRGPLRKFPQHIPAWSRRGFPRRLYDDTKNVRVEVIRKGRDPKFGYEFEIPDRYMRYVEHYAKAKAFEHQGDSQDLKLSQHYMQRYEIGVQRLRRRAQRTLRSRVGHFGTGGIAQSKPPLVKFPWPYPKVNW